MDVRKNHKEKVAATCLAGLAALVLTACGAGLQRTM